MTMTTLTIDGAFHTWPFDCIDGMHFHVIGDHDRPYTLSVAQVLCEVVEPVVQEDSAYVVTLVDGGAAYIENCNCFDWVFVCHSIADLAQGLWQEPRTVLEFLALRTLGALRFAPVAQ